MSELPGFDRIMWRGKTLLAMSENELRFALRECWIERKARARAECESTPRSGSKSPAGNFSKILDGMFGGKP